MSVFFTSDQHFGHTNIIKYCNRPFTSIEEMDQAIIDNWNSVVDNKDFVYIIGDLTMSYKKDKMREIFNQLKGTKALIKGNHDHKGSIPTECFVDIWKRVRVTGDNYDYILIHDPAEASANHMNVQKYLCGHLHRYEAYLPGTNWIDVGVDANNFTPISLEKTIKLFTNETEKESGIIELLFP